MKIVSDAGYHGFVGIDGLDRCKAGILHHIDRAHPQQHLVDLRLVAGKHLTGRARQEMREGAPDLDRLAGGQVRQMPRHLLGELDQPGYIGAQRAMIQGRVHHPAVMPPFLALDAHHPGAGAELERPAHRRHAQVIVRIVLQHLPDAVGIADHEQPAPQVAPRHEQLVEQPLVAGGKRVGGECPNEPQGRERALGPGRHRQLRRRPGLVNLIHPRGACHLTAWLARSGIWDQPRCVLRDASFAGSSG